MEPMHTPTLLGIGEAARLLSVSVDTLRRWADDGRLRTVVLPSGHRRFFAEDVQALLDQGKASA